MRCDLALRNQRRPVGDDLFDFGPTAREPVTAGGPVRIRGAISFRESLDCGRDPEHALPYATHFGQIA